jgi:hypothetical protein
LKHRVNKQAVATVVFFVLALGAFSNIMNSPVDHNEHMYISAGVLAKENILYKDFAFLQMPYLPIVYGALYKITGTTHYLLTGRLASFFFMVSSTLLVYLISYKLTRSLFTSAFMVLFFVLNEVIIISMQESSNYIMPIAFSLLGFYLFITSVFEERIKSPGVFLSGLSLAVATGTRLYYATILVPFLIVSLIYPASVGLEKRFKKVFLPLTAGVVAGLLPVFYYILKHPDLFVFYNYGYHKINALWIEVAGLVSGMSAPSKVLFGWRMFLDLPGNIVVFIALTFVFFAAAGGLEFKKDSLKGLLGMEGFLAALLVLFSTITYFVPSPLRVQYAALLVPFAIVLTCCLYGKVSEENRQWVKILFVCLLVVSVSSGRVGLFKYLDRMFDTEDWVGVKIHGTSLEIRENIGNGKVATLSPLFAVEAGLPIYKELATGPFLYRVGDLIPVDKRAHYGVTSPASLAAMLDRDPPGAILVGFEGGLDMPFERYAAENGYVELGGDYLGGRLFVRKPGWK